MPLKRLGSTGMIGAAVFLLAGLWVVLNTSLAAAFAGPVAMLTANLRLFIGLLIIAAVGYWALDEAEENDQYTDVAEKTGERAADASRGFINSTTVILGAALGVVVATGDMLVEVVGQAPAIAGQVGIGILGLAGAGGLLSVPVVAVGALLVVVLSAIAMRSSA